MTDALASGWSWTAAFLLIVPAYSLCLFGGRFSLRAGLGAALIGWGMMCVFLTIIEGDHPLSLPLTGNGFVAAGALVLLGISLCVGHVVGLLALVGIYILGPGIVSALGYGGGYEQHVQDAVGVVWIGLFGLGGLAGMGVPICPACGK